MDPSPPISPSAGNVRERYPSNSPMPAREAAHISKREKRRHMLQDKLEQMTAQFSSNRDLHYREQLQAIQIDMNLIMDTNPFTDEPVVADPTGIDHLVREQMKKMKNVGPEPPPRAGRIYADWAKEINDGIEAKDAALAQHQRDFEVRMNELYSTHAYQTKVAQTEHKALSSTLRDRLINSVLAKKNRLSRDRETIEIGESSALLLHPSQYGHANPSSPGGIHGKRATRHRRDLDELPGFGESHKRKRKAGDNDDSPGPSRQRIDNGSSTPLWFAEKQALIAKQLESPLYSIDKLFTEKELHMTYNTAALAAHSHMQRHPPYSDDIDSPPNGKSESSSDREKDGNGDAEAEQPESPPGGAMMERQYSHATRSTRGTANYITGLGIDALSDINAPGNFQSLTRQIPKLPPFLSYGTIKVYAKGEGGTTPASLPPDDIAAELELIRRARSYNDEKGIGSNLELENGGKTLLEMASYPRTFNYWVASENKGSYIRGSHIDREEASAGGGGSLAMAMSGVEMERQDSRVSNTSDMMGGTPMSRTATGEGVTSSKGRKIIRREAV